MFAAAGIKNVNAIGRESNRGAPPILLFPSGSSLAFCLSNRLNFFLENSLIGETGQLPLLTRYDNPYPG